MNHTFTITRIYDAVLAVALIATFFLCDNTVGRTQAGANDGKFAQVVAADAQGVK